MKIKFNTKSKSNCLQLMPTNINKTNQQSNRQSNQIVKITSQLTDNTHIYIIILLFSCWCLLKIYMYIDVYL